MEDFVAPNDDFDNNEEYALDMLYDNALDGGHMLVYDPPCLTIVTNSCEDKNDKLVAYVDNINMRALYYS
jgi:hypothetical protein